VILYCAMPGRLIPLISDQCYHVIFRGVSSQDIFLTCNYYQRALDLMEYYRSKDTPLRFSYLQRMDSDKRSSILKALKEKEDGYLVDIYAYALMPNHVHLLMKQKVNNGISVFMRNLQDSYARYFNLKNGRKGHLFESRFRAKHIGSEEVLIHVFRYIILNPYSAGVIKRQGDLESYPYTSLVEYKGGDSGSICELRTLLNRFGGYASLKEFVLDNADYQKSLEEIKHLMME